MRGRGRAPWLADEDAAGRERLEDAEGEGAVAAGVDGDEVGGGADRAEVVLGGDAIEPLAGGFVALDDLCQPGLIGERLEAATWPILLTPKWLRTRLKAAIVFCFAEGVADAEAGEAVGLREGAEADDVGAVDVDGGQGAGGRGLAVGLVEEEHALLRDAPRRSARCRRRATRCPSGCPGCRDRRCAGGRASPREEPAEVLAVGGIGDGQSPRRRLRRGS